RMIGHEHRRHARAPQRLRDRFLPEFDRTPRLPQEVERTAQHVVARRHAGQRADEMRIELDGTAREAIEIRRVELAPTIAREHVSIEAIEEYDDDVLRHVHGCAPIGREVDSTESTHRMLPVGGCFTAAPNREIVPRTGGIDDSYGRTADLRRWL